jgi:erythromycin esterase
MKTNLRIIFPLGSPVATKLLMASLSIMAVLFLLASCNSKSDPSPSSAKVLETLNNQGFGNLITPISSLTPTSSTADLATLNAFVADKQIVALGESTHGTSEFVTFRHRMIQHMVQQLNFRVLSVETNFSTAQAINEYILGGTGTGLDVVQSIKNSWVYDNQEFVQLIEWLRTYNSGQSAANKVTFYGFDNQACEPSAKRVQAYISQYDPSYLSAFNTTSKHFLNDFEEYFTKYSNEQLLKILPTSVSDFRNQWNTISTYFQSNKAGLIAKSGERAYELTLRHWKIVQQSFNGFIYVEDELKSFNYRDTTMADNVDWIRKFENSKKMILWAHAGHSGNNNTTTTQMGYHLKQRYQANYYTVGFFTNGGSVRVIDLDKKLGVTKIDPKPEHVITQAFALGKWSQFFLPISAVNANVELSKLFSTPQKVYFIGSTLEKSTLEQKLGVYYDAIVFIEKTNGTTPN